MHRGKKAAIVMQSDKVRLPGSGPSSENPLKSAMTIEVSRIALAPLRLDASGPLPNVIFCRALHSTFKCHLLLLLI
jgi:hypothetical protein